MSEDERPYEVGFWKPPASGKFVKGQSGNPGGRPKGSENFATTVARELRQRVQVKGPKGTRSMTKWQATIMQLVNKAAQGDFRSQREIISLAQALDAAKVPGEATFIPNNSDRKAMEDMLHRLELFAEGNASTNPGPEKEES
jgi:hypothetical protein